MAFRVIQTWVDSIPPRAQGTLLTGIRGCDVAPKPVEQKEFSSGLEGVNTVERQLTAFLRYCVANPADPRETDIPGAWFQSRPPDHWRASQIGHFPLHWYSHLMHCFEVVAYYHPDVELASLANDVYQKMVYSLHLNPETFEQMEARLTEDRLAAGTVVS